MDPGGTLATMSLAGDKASMFKDMLDAAESEEEQSLALQIALGERLRQLREEGGDPEARKKLEQALELLRDGNAEEAIRCMSE